MVLPKPQTNLPKIRRGRFGATAIRIHPGIPSRQDIWMAFFGPYLPPRYPPVMAPKKAPITKILAEYCSFILTVIRMYHTKPRKFLTGSLNCWYKILIFWLHFILDVRDCYSRESHTVAPNEGREINSQDSMSFPHKVGLYKCKHGPSPLIESELVYEMYKFENTLKRKIYKLKTLLSIILTV